LGSIVPDHVIIKQVCGPIILNDVIPIYGIQVVRFKWLFIQINVKWRHVIQHVLEVEKEEGVRWRDQ